MSVSISNSIFIDTVSVDSVPLPNMPDIRLDKYRRLYKFLHHRDIEYLTVDETIKINSSKVFRDEYFKMEVGNPRINDPEEGKNYNHQRHFATEQTAQCDNSVGVFLEPFHLLSLAMGTFKEGCAAFCRPDVGLDEPYDACVEIVDVLGFIELIKSSALVQNPQTYAYDLSIEGLFRAFHYHPVIYADINRVFAEDIRTFIPPAPNPYTKALDLAQQQEFRLVFFPRQYALKPEPIFVKLPGLARLLKVHGPDEIKRALDAGDQHH